MNIVHTIGWDCLKQVLFVLLNIEQNICGDETTKSTECYTDWCSMTLRRLRAGRPVCSLGLDLKPATGLNFSYLVAFSLPQQFLLFIHLISYFQAFYNQVKLLHISCIKFESSYCCT